MIRNLIRLLVVTVLGTLALAGCTSGTDPNGAGSGDSSTGGVAVDVIYLDHPPVQPVLDDVNQVLSKYEGKLAVNRHDAESPAGQELAEDLGLTGHVAFAIAIDGSVRVDVDGRTASFEGFPAGRAPIASAEGSWELDELDAALAERTSRGNG